VDNPLYTALNELLTSIKSDEPTMSNALKNSCQQMGGGTVWVGSAASGWSSQLTGYASSLSTSIGSAVDVVSSALASTPKTCTPAQAQAYWMMMRLNDQ
jgi:hypothetical protein